MWLLLFILLATIILYRCYRQRQILENLTDKYVLITGCDSGFGNLAARQLDKRGLKVLATCLTKKGAEDLKRETSSRLQTVILDVTDSQSVCSTAEWVGRIVGNKGLWGLVNNAGFGHCLAPNEWQRKEDFSKARIKAHGRIVNVSSALGRLSSVGGGYCISKFGVEAFSDSLRRELRFFGIKISIIEPGCFATAMSVTELHKKNLKYLWDNLPMEVKEIYGEPYYQKYVQCLSGLTGSASENLNKVTDCMEHALTAIHPWTRYSPGLDSKLYYIPLSYFPTVIADFLLCRSEWKPVPRAG
ncbi:hypothetical protein GDO86_004318 [Hymenochirus boettgeri]|uniref:Uncharacterized protein n=1 Tax=Hymenochirus boettgeri TaxID=247094 RepID=A0A8T2KA37_9PIPI|nr:hypothetical protein GDO86_004318 [Hymenochirus boettgeri]